MTLAQDLIKFYGDSNSAVTQLYNENRYEADGLYDFKDKIYDVFGVIDSDDYANCSPKFIFEDIMGHYFLNASARYRALTFMSMIWSKPLTEQKTIEVLNYIEANY